MFLTLTNQMPMLSNSASRKARSLFEKPVEVSDKSYHFLAGSALSAYIITSHLSCESIAGGTIFPEENQDANWGRAKWEVCLSNASSGPLGHANGVCERFPSLLQKVSTSSSRKEAETQAAEWWDTGGNPKLGLRSEALSNEEQSEELGSGQPHPRAPASPTPPC